MHTAGFNGCACVLGSTNKAMPIRTYVYSIPQRKLICRASVTEIDQLTSRPSFNRNKRKRRIIFIFSDQVIICKRRGGDQLEYRGSFSLMDAIAISFETHYYKNGIQIYSSHDEKAIFQCCCDTNDDRRTLLHTLESTISELRELEKERIAELGTSMTKSQEIEPERRRRMASRAGDLLSSSQLNKATSGSVRGRREGKGDYVSGVGDLVISSTTTTIIRRTSKSSGTSSQPENRTSGGSHESGYDSQRTTPMPSPSPTNPPHSTPQQPPSVTIPPSSSSSSYIPKRPLQGRQSTTSAPMTLMTPAIPVTRSRSTDQIHLTRVMTITPTLNRETKMRFSSVEDVRGNRSPKSSSASNSPRISKKKDRTRSSEKKGLFSLSPFHRGSSPVVEKRSVTNNRPRTMSETPSPPPSSDLELCTRSVTTRASSYLVNTT